MSQAPGARHTRRGTQKTELRHKVSPEVPKEQGQSTARDMLLPDETGARSLFLPKHYSCVCHHIFSCLTTGDKDATPLLALDEILPAVIHRLLTMCGQILL